VQACKDNINRQFYNDLSSYLGPQAVHLGVDTIGTGVTLISGVGVYVGVVLGIDGLVNAACTIQTVLNMSNAANRAADQQCKCPSQ